jgi:hypothetical protein
MDGRSLLDPSWTRDRILLENWHPAFPPWSALMTYDHEYIEYQEGDEPVPLREYYDLVGDPWQLFNPFGDLDPSNDPDTSADAIQLELDRSCAGTSNGPGDPPECP